MEKPYSVDDYLSKHLKYSDVLIHLRKILLNTPLQETIKWGMPTYTFENKNLIGVGAFKNHVSIWFFQGALLKDSYKLLANVQKGKTKAMRQIRFQQVSEINENIISEYVYETLDNLKNGLVVKPQKNTKPIVIPNELANALKSKKELEKCFYELTLGKQREYSEYISTAKRDLTKLSRLKKITPLILEKKGLHDKYKNC